MLDQKATCWLSYFYTPMHARLQPDHCREKAHAMCLHVINCSARAPVQGVFFAPCCVIAYSRARQRRRLDTHTDVCGETRAVARFDVDFELAPPALSDALRYAPRRCILRCFQIQVVERACVCTVQRRVGPRPRSFACVDYVQPLRTPTF